MKKSMILAVLLMCLLFTSCGSSDIGIIGGTDGPTGIIVSEKKNDTEQKFFDKYIDIIKLPVLDVHIESPLVVDDRTLILEDTVENNLELMIYEYYRAKITGEYSEVKNTVMGKILSVAIENEENQFKDGIYFNKIVLDRIGVVNKEDLRKISEGNKQSIIKMLDELKISEFAIVEVNKTIELNEKYLNSGPQIGNGESTRYYLVGKKDNEYKILEVYWEGFIVE